MRIPNKSLSTKQKAVVLLLFLVPAVLILGKWSGSPIGDFLRRHITLTGIPAHMADHARYVLFVPIGAVLVVFFRLTLGIRVLGPFRAILIAVAFRLTGILHGVIFLGAVIAGLVAMRPLLKKLRLPYFARISIVLSAISSIMIIALLFCEWLGSEMLGRSAYFPIVVLCLTAEGFARTLTKEGSWSALWRGAMTVLVAVLATLMSSVEAIDALYMNYPELLMALIGSIIIIGIYLDFRILEGLNPPVKKRRRAKKGKPVSQAAGQASPEPVLEVGGTMPRLSAPAPKSPAAEAR